MPSETDAWLRPMVKAVLASPGGMTLFAQLMEECVTIPDGAGVDWVHVGQLLRDDLGWDRHPRVPSDGHELTEPNAR